MLTNRGDGGRDGCGFHLFWVPCNCTDSFPTKVVQRQTLLFGLNIPDSHKACTASSDQNMRHFLIPVETFNVVGSSRSISKSEGMVDVVEIGNKKL